MKNRTFLMMVAFLVPLVMIGKKHKAVEYWPDGQEISAWFSDTSRVDVSGMKHYDVTEYGVDRWTDAVQTKALQAVIDRCAAEGAVWSSFQEARLSVALFSLNHVLISR